MNTNKNSYTLIYASVLVIIVAFLLAAVSSALKPTQEQNVALDKKKQILASLNIRDLDKSEIEAKYTEVVVSDAVVKSDGTVIAAGSSKDQDGFLLSSKDINSESLPFYTCSIDGQTKYVVPMTGRGLWGGLWGYMAINADLETIYGAYFSHESETAGLGALIAEKAFQEQFNGMTIFEDSTCSHVALTVVKHGKVNPARKHFEVDGITGSTLTSNGVANMVQAGLQLYADYFHILKKGTASNEIKE